MTKNPDQREIAAFARLRADADFTVVIEYLKRWQGALHADIPHTRDDVELRMQQGALHTLNHLLEIASIADTLAYRQR